MDNQKCFDIIDKMVMSDKHGKTVDLTDQSKIKYKNLAKRLGKENIDIFGSEAEIIDKVCAWPEQTYHKFHDHLSLAYRIRKDAGLPVDQLIEVKSDAKYYDLNCLHKKVEEELVLPDIKKMLSFVEYLWNSDYWVEYIVNYLIIHVCVRNQDLNLVVIKTSDPSEAGEQETEEDNYLFVGPDKVLYMRKKYKTSQSYGPKKITMTDPLFVHACKGYLDNTVSKFLLAVKTGSRISESTLATKVQSLTYQGMGETKMFKTIASCATKEDLKKIARLRGTDVGTILSYYNKDNTCSFDRDDIVIEE